MATQMGWRGGSATRCEGRCGRSQATCAVEVGGMKVSDSVSVSGVGRVIGTYIRAKAKKWREHLQADAVMGSWQHELQHGVSEGSGLHGERLQKQCCARLWLSVSAASSPQTAISYSPKRYPAAIWPHILWPGIIHPPAPTHPPSPLLSPTLPPLT